MFDVTGPLLVVVLIGVFSLLPKKSYFVGSKDSLPQKVAFGETAPVAKAGEIPEDEELKRHCLTNFRAEIETSFGPRPTDSILKRHHDALIVAELEKRLSELTT